MFATEKGGTRILAKHTKIHVTDVDMNKIREGRLVKVKEAGFEFHEIRCPRCLWATELMGKKGTLGSWRCANCSRSVEGIL